MGWFLGHLLPGLAWLSMGIFHLLQSLHTVPITNSFRKKPFWLAFRSFCLVIFAAAAMTIENIDEWNSWGSSNVQHMIMWGGLAMSAITEYMVLTNIVTDSFLSLIPPMGMCYISFMLVLHAQKVVFWSYLHIYSGVVVAPIFFIFAAGQAIRHHSIKKKEKLLTHPPAEKNTSIFISRNKLEDLNPYLTDEAPYDTVAPGLAAFFIIYESITWIEMAFQMGPYNAENLPNDPPNPLLSIFEVATKNFLVACLICAFVSHIARYFSKKLSHQIHDDDNSSLI